MADVFISYARADWSVAKALADELLLLGYEVWWDAELIGTDDFRDTIMEKLTAAKAVVVIWSSTSVRSRFVRDEASRALAGKKLVSTMLVELDLAELPLGFGGHHTSSVTDRRNIIRALSKLGVQAHGANSKVNHLYSNPAHRRGVPWSAILFAAGSVPFLVALAGLFHVMDWGWAGKKVVMTEQKESSAFVLGALLVTVLGTLLAHVRAATSTATELGLYWLGSALALGFSMPTLFVLLEWNFVGQTRYSHSGPLASGAILVSLLVVGSAGLFARIRAAALTGVELGLYWFGSALVVMSSMETLFWAKGWNVFGPGPTYARGSGYAIGLLLAIASGFGLRYQFRFRKNRPRSSAGVPEHR